MPLDIVAIIEVDRLDGLEAIMDGDGGTNVGVGTICQPGLANWERFEILETEWLGRYTILEVAWVDPDLRLLVVYRDATPKMMDKWKRINPFVGKVESPRVWSSSPRAEAIFPSTKEGWVTARLLVRALLLGINEGAWKRKKE